MATVTLHADQTARNDLPAVCMACGQPVTTHIRTTLSWFPPWLYFLLPAFLILLILAMVFTKRMTFDMPVCDRHRGYWWKRTIWMFVPMVVVVVLAVVIPVILVNVNRNGGYGCVVSALLFVGWIVFAMCIRISMIMPAEITDEEITLKRVHDDFVTAFRQMERTPRRRARRNYDDDDEDFEDRKRRRRRRERADDDRPPDKRDGFRAQPDDF